MLPALEQLVHTPGRPSRRCRVLLCWSRPTTTSGVLGGTSARAWPSAGLPTCERRVLLGRSLEGRAIYAYELGDPSSPRKVLVVGCIHGDETAGVGSRLGANSICRHDAHQPPVATCGDADAAGHCPSGGDQYPVYGRQLGGRRCSGRTTRLRRVQPRDSARPPGATHARDRLAQGARVRPCPGVAPRDHESDAASRRSA